MILSILGLPESDYERMMTLTQELFGATDPDLQRGQGTPEEIGAVIMEFYMYFAQLTQERMADPTDDLASLIANGEIRGEPMPDLEKLGYYIIIATAGHDTTSASMSEGMAQLAQHPEQLELLRSDPSLITNAVEEMIRLASPVRHFMRTATDDTEIAGQQIKKGDWLMLHYTAANLDPRHFAEPARVRRDASERQQADRVRVRDPLLPRCPAGPPGAPLAVQPPRASPRQCRTGRWRSDEQGGLRQRLQVAAAPLHPQVTVEHLTDRSRLAARFPKLSCVVAPARRHAPISGNRLESLKFSSRSRVSAPMNCREANPSHVERIPGQPAPSGW